MIAVHFGAGNIGRGFIGYLLSKSGYEVCFVDVNADLVDKLNEKNEYPVELTNEDRHEILVTGVRAIHSLSQPEQVVNEIVRADLITTAVGPQILEKISPLLAKGLQLRMQVNSQPLHLIACENMIHGSSFLKSSISKLISPENLPAFEQLFDFPNAAVDRIVPLQTHINPLKVTVETFYEWIIEHSRLKNKMPEIAGVSYVENLTPFIERKLFTVNTGHVTIAYLGYQAGATTIQNALENQTILHHLKHTLHETGDVLIKKYHWNVSEHRNYIEKIIQRFQNPFIQDEITRVARGPLRKLGPSDRLVFPAIQYYTYIGESPIHLAQVIASLLKYDYAYDDEAQRLQEMIKHDGYQKTLQTVSQLEVSHPLLELVMEYI